MKLSVCYRCIHSSADIFKDNFYPGFLHCRPFQIHNKVFNLFQGVAVMQLLGVLK